MRFRIGGSAPATLGFNAFGPEWLLCGATRVAPAVPATELALGSHPCVALSSARVLPEWAQLASPTTLFQPTAITPLTSCLKNRRTALHPHTALHTPRYQPSQQKHHSSHHTRRRPSPRLQLQ